MTQMKRKEASRTWEKQMENDVLQVIVKAVDPSTLSSDQEIYHQCPGY
jgi:hypothetical protein